MNLVAYYRLSTRQRDMNERRLSLQQKAVEDYARQVDGEIVAEYTEMEKAKRFDWPALKEAIAHVKRVQGILVMARLENLIRSVTFTATLKESGIDFICCDNPHVNPQTIPALAAAAENDRKRISERIKAGLQTAKEHGVKLGSAREGHWEGREDRRREGARKGLPMAVRAAADARTIRAAEIYSKLMPRIVEMRNEEGLTLHEIAERLNAKGHKTSVGMPFTPTMINRLLRRAAIQNIGSQATPPEPPADFSDLPLFAHLKNQPPDED